MTSAGMGERNSSVNSLKRLPRLPRPAHLFVEAAVAGGRGAAVQRGADDRVFRVGQQDLLRRDFGFGIDAQRIDGRGFVVVARPPVEDQIGGQEDQRDVRRQLREQGGDFDVELAGQRGVGLAFRTLAERGAVDDQLRVAAAGTQRARRRSRSGQVLASQRDHACIRREVRRASDQIIADQPAGASDPDRFQSISRCVKPVVGVDPAVAQERPVGARVVHLGRGPAARPGFRLSVALALARISPEVPATKLWPQNSMPSPPPSFSWPTRLTAAT